MKKDWEKWKVMLKLKENKDKLKAEKNKSGHKEETEDEHRMEFIWKCVFTN